MVGTVSPPANLPQHSDDGSSGDHGPVSVRADQWLWAIRLTKTRSGAADACRGGHVKINGKSAKPSTPVKIGDTVEARLGDRERVVEASQLIVKRVGAAQAAECFVDHSPPPPPRDEQPPVFARERGSGRRTKRDRRKLDALRGRRH
jgi:ribosome-associated heat shock protein Hsp15